MTINKIFALIIVFVLASTLLVFAYADESSEVTDDAPAEESAEAVGPAIEDAGAKKAKSIKQTIEERVAKKKDLLERAKQTRDEARVALKAEKNSLKEAQNKFKQAKKELQDFRKAVAKCSGVQSDECKKARKDNKMFTAKFVDGTIEQIFRMIERAREGVQDAGLSDEKKAQLESELDARLAEINALRQKQGQIQAQSTAQEIRDAAKNIKEFWKAAKESVKQNNLHINSARFGGVLVQAEKLQERLNKRLEEFNGQGKDVSGLDAKMSSFAEKLGAAKALNDDVQGLLESLDSADDKNVVMKDAAEKMRDAHAQLRDARILLKQIKDDINAQDTLSAGLEE